jgi:hypothetical protein
MAEAVRSVHPPWPALHSIAADGEVNEENGVRVRREEKRGELHSH